MSRTTRGTKAPGHEYWSRRLGGAPIPGRLSKKRTHKAERLAEPEIIEDGLREREPSDDEVCFICHRSHPWEPDEDTCEQYIIDRIRYG